MNMKKIIEWIKSLFKKKEVPVVEEQVETTPVEEIKQETVAEVKSVVKKKRRGRPRKKKVEQK